MKKNSWEIILYILAVCLAAALRLSALGGSALSTLEASQALQALKLFHGYSATVTTSPIYVGWTGVVFQLFGSSDLAARILPALAGILFVLVPLFYRKKLGEIPAVILAFFLAVDPFLIYLSREASGEMLAIACVVFFFTALLYGSSIWIGILGALTILSGPSAFTGLAAILAAGLWVGGRILDGEDPDLKLRCRNIDWKSTLLSAGLTLLAAGLIFLRAPFLINGVGAGLIAALQGWIPIVDEESQGMILRLLVALLFLAPLANVLGITGLVRGVAQKKRLSGFLWRWGLIALVIVFLYPAHRVTDLAWVSIPLCVAAAGEVQNWVHKPASHQAISYIFAAASSLLLIFCGLKITGLLAYEPGSADYQLALAGIALTLLMLAVASILIGWGWSWKASFYGLGIGAVVALGIFSLSMSRRAANLMDNQAANILNPVSYPYEIRLLSSTIDDISRQNRGVADDLGISVLNMDSPSLEWGLRDNSKISFISSLSKTETPELLITNGNENPQLSASYRGQDFAYTATVPWSLLTGKEWLNWVIFGNASLQKEYLILWAQNALFPEGSGTPVKE